MNFFRGPVIRLDGLAQQTGTDLKFQFEMLLVAQIRDDVAPQEVVVLEGVGMASRRLRAQAALSVWVDVDAALGIERVVQRDGEAMRGEIVRWQRDEARWHTLDGTREAADVRLRGQ